MSKIGVFVSCATGHLNPTIALCRELKRRGHDVTFFGVADALEKVTAAGLGYISLGEKDYPLGTTSLAARQLGELSGNAARRFTYRHLQRMAALSFEHGLPAVRESHIDLILVDQIEPAGPTIANHLGVPYVTIATGGLTNREIGVPPITVGWAYGGGLWKAVRNRLGYAQLDRETKTISKYVNQWRRRWKLPPYRTIDETLSPLAQLSQEPFEFEFPRQRLPQCVHFLGPFIDVSARKSTPFPWNRLTGEPLVYVSMGTLQNRNARVFQCIAEACLGFSVQLVMSMGGGGLGLAELPGAPLIVDYAPQLGLLSKAALTITHAGLNTVMEALSRGVPMVAIPVASDQPGVAARVARIGAGEVVPLCHLDGARLRTSIERVLHNESFKQQAVRFQKLLRNYKGAAGAADVIERVVVTGRAVDWEPPLYRSAAA